MGTPSWYAQSEQEVAVGKRGPSQGARYGPKMTAVYSGVQDDEWFALDAERAKRPWTEAQYHRIRKEAKALFRTRRSIDLPNERGCTVVDGQALWRLMGAVDRLYLDDDET